MKSAIYKSKNTDLVATRVEIDYIFSQNNQDFQTKLLT